MQCSLTATWVYVKIRTAIFLSKFTSIISDSLTLDEQQITTHQWRKGTHSSLPFFINCTTASHTEFLHVTLPSDLSLSAFIHTHTHSIFSIQILHILATPSFMALFPLLLLILMVPSSSNAQWPPSPGYWPGSRFRSMSFYQGYRNLWGYSHQRVDQNALTIWLDSTSGLTRVH
jgi:hypothetical protein